MPNRDVQTQHNGVDLTVAGIFEPAEEFKGRIDKNGKEIGNRKEVESDEDGVYQLEEGAYVVTYNETISVPDEGVGFVYPRSSLMRNFNELHTAVWDSGYEGKGEGLLKVNAPLELEQDCRIGQFVVADSNPSGTYTGSYQGERID